MNEINEYVVSSALNNTSWAMSRLLNSLFHIVHVNQSNDRYVSQRRVSPERTAFASSDRGTRMSPRSRASVSGRRLHPSTTGTAS